MKQTSSLGFCALLVLCVGVASAQAPSDTLYLHHGQPIGVELVELTPEVVRYRLPGESLVRSYGRAAIHAIKHRSGRAELISDYQTLAPDWTIDRVVELPSVEAAQGLVLVGVAEAKTQGVISLHSMRTAERVARRRLLRRAVLRHGRFVIFEHVKQSGAGLINQAWLRARLYDYPTGLQPTLGQGLALISPDLPEQALLWSLGIDSIAVVGRRALTLGESLRVNRNQLVYRDTRTGADSVLGRLAVAAIRRAGQPGYLKLTSRSWALPGINSQSTFLATSTDEVRGLVPEGREYLYECSYDSEDLDDLQEVVARALNDAIISQRLLNTKSYWSFCGVLETVHPATVQATLARAGMQPLRRIASDRSTRGRGGRLFILIRPYRRGS